MTRVAELRASAAQIPTDMPEADGTLEWDSTTVVLVEARSDSGETGIGYTYSSRAAAELVAEKLAGPVRGSDVLATGSAWAAMVAAVRNVGRPGVAATAISAVDVALWDLKARCLDLPLFKLLGPFRDQIPVYGSGGFTSYPDQQLREQLRGFVEQGIPRVKMKLGAGWGSREDEDVERVALARDAIGPDAELFVDANGAYDRKQAVMMAGRFHEAGRVTYFEEPVSSDDLEGLRFVRERAPMAIAAGEYGYDPWYFRAMLEAQAVDVLQADVTRCLGITGWLQAAALAHAHHVSFSAHTAPAIHAHVGCAAPRFAHLEYFWDHVRIEEMLFEGTLTPVEGSLRPDPERQGLGLTLRPAAAERFEAA